MRAFLLALVLAAGGCAHARKPAPVEPLHRVEVVTPQRCGAALSAHMHATSTALEPVQKPSNP